MSDRRAQYLQPTVAELRTATTELAPVSSEAVWHSVDTDRDDPEVTEKWSRPSVRPTKPNTSFFRLAQQRAFNEIAYNVQNDRIETLEWLHEDCSLATPLHILLEHQPPLYLVNLMIQSLPGCESSKDRLGSTPLHVASASACSVAVIARLFNAATSKFPNPAAILDDCHRSPLHWACTVTTTTTQYNEYSEQTKQARENLIHVIGFLLKAHPASVKVCDLHGKTPGDIATELSADPAILQLLCRVSLKQRQSSQQSPTSKDEAIEKVMLITTSSASLPPGNKSIHSDHEDASSVTLDDESVPSEIECRASVKSKSCDSSGTTATTRQTASVSTKSSEQSVNSSQASGGSATGEYSSVQVLSSSEADVAHKMMRSSEGFGMRGKRSDRSGNSLLLGCKLSWHNSVLRSTEYEIAITKARLRIKDQAAKPVRKLDSRREFAERVYFV